MTLYLTNPGSSICHGPGRLLHAQASPPAFVRGCVEGRVPDLAPAIEDFVDLRNGRIRPEDYRARFEARLERVGELLRPGVLRVACVDPLLDRPPREGSALVEDGDTVVCTCSVVLARSELCHRSWAARPLVRAGWRVVLDGEEVRDEDRPAGSLFGRRT